MKIVISEPLSVSDSLLESLTLPLEDNGHEVVSYSQRAKDKEELISRVKDADIVITANQPFGEDVVGALENCKFLDVAFTGTDHIGKKAAEEKKIVISNAQGYATEAVAELALGMMIDLLRKITPLDAKTRDGEGRGSFAGSELRGKTVGIIGTGDIGIRIAELLKPFGVDLVGYSRSRRKEAEKAGIVYTDLDDLLERSDLVNLCVPLTEETRGLIGEESFDKMKPTAFLVNTARGPVVDEAALVEALNDGKIAGAALDVFDTEPPLSKNADILKAQNTVLTPHIGYASQESFDDRAKIVFENVQAFLEGKPQNVVK